MQQSLLRYWETRFPQLRPVTRAGNRRYYRPEDVALVERIARLLNDEGYTVRGVQKLLKDEGRGARADAPDVPAPSPDPAPAAAGGDRSGVRAVRDFLCEALERDSRG